MSFEEDYVGPGPDEEALMRQREWSEGVHTTSKGDTIHLKDMNTGHLKNTIQKFERAGHDVTALKEELNRRDQHA